MSARSALRRRDLHIYPAGSREAAVAAKTAAPSPTPKPRQPRDTMSKSTQRASSEKRKAPSQASRSAADQAGGASPVVDNRAGAQQLAQMKSAIDSGAQSEAPVQRIMSAADFKTKSYVGKTSSRGGTLSAVDEWLAEYHTLPAVPKNSTERDTKVEVLEEIIETADQWIDKHPEGGKETEALKKRRPVIVELKTEAAAEKATVLTIVFKDTEMAVSKTDPTTTKVNQKLEGDFKQASEKLSSLIDLAVPQKNTTAELEVELSVPVGSGVNMGFHFDAEAEKDEESDIETKLKLGVTAGGSISVAKLQAELGGFMEAKAGSASEVMKLLSYAMYQRFRESSVLPREIANYMWGGSTSDRGAKLADRWAAKIEKGVLDAATDKRERYVRRGAYGAAKIAGGVTAGKLGFQAGKKYFNEYNRASIEKQMGGKKLKDMSVKDIAKMRLPSARGARTSLGDSKSAAFYSLALEFGPISGDAKYTLKGKASELELSAGASFNLLELGGGGAGAALVSYIGNMVTRMSPLLSEEADQEEDPNAAAVGASLVGDFASSVQTVTEALKSDPKIEFESFDPNKAKETSRTSSVGVDVSAKWEEKKGKLEKWEVKLTAKKSRGIDSPVIAVSFEQGKVIRKWGS